jgi:hypothetical protein
MKNSWVTQLVVVFIPVVTAIYLPKASPRAAWASMLLALAVWLGYCGYFFVNSPGSFVEIMNNFDRPVTCGAVYGFAAGLAAFFCCYAAENIYGRFKEKK